jgi:hypothetical protein
MPSKQGHGRCSSYHAETHICMLYLFTYFLAVLGLLMTC